MVQFVILCVREFQIVRMKSRFSLFCFEKLILIFSFSCSSFCTFSFPSLFSVKMCSAMVFDRPLPICKIHPKEIWRLSRLKHQCSLPEPLDHGGVQEGIPQVEELCKYQR